MFEPKIHSKFPNDNFLQKMDWPNKFQFKNPIFNKADVTAIWWPNSAKNILFCGQLKTAYKNHKYICLV